MYPHAYTKNGTSLQAKFNGQDTKCVIDHFLKKQYEEKDAGVVPIVDDSKIVSVIIDLSISSKCKMLTGRLKGCTKRDVGWDALMVTKMIGSLS